MIEKTYQPGAVEGRIYAEWEKAGAFRAGRPQRAAAKPYCIVIPPPNVTGSLHMGHALNNTLQDILCRFERMRGRDVLWQPGTDHAGIATQAVVERQLMERQEPGSRAMGREAFIKRVWEWKAESGGTIIGQLKRLGASCDWSRERFTMDEGLSRAVMKVFVALYREGLIYKDKRLVNWDPKLKTAISDLEVVLVETKGNLWHIKYPIEDSDEFIVVATTRPETMLGDVAVAVHPENERLKHLIGKTAILPLVGRRIPIIGDDYADPEKGTGAVKITPAHDFNDFEVGKRHDLAPINVLDAEAALDLKDNAGFLHGLAPSAVLDETLSLHGLDRFAARKKIVERLEAAGLLDKIEPTVHAVPHGDRSGAVVEPYLTDQWYVDAKTLAQPAIAAVRARKTVFVPAQWEATFFNWMENIQPWCISRQIWWGHQIPAWYGPDGKVFVAESEDDVVADALAHYTEIEEITVEEGHDIAADPARRTRFANEYLKRDEDVLDTWFSSALWPFSTLGWPDQTAELKRYYPTTTLVTGFDIIFFWVARMMMMGLHFMKEVPFHDVYIHALVRDASGAKMSKSKGNVIDPLALIDQFGADALRFTLAAMAAQGRDIKLSEQRVEGYRNFATKLWNAARFAEVNGCAHDPDFDPHHAKQILNRWIAHETAKAGREVTAAIEAYKFNEAAAAIYRFVWNVYCDWYVELAKPVLTGPDGAAKSETRAATMWALDEILKLLHPFMPFVTEELWAVTAEAGYERHHMLALDAWPAHDGLDDEAAEAEIGWVVDLVTAIRSVRVEMNIPPVTMLPLVLAGVSAETRARAQRWAEFVQRLARVADISFVDAPPQGAVQLVVRGEVAALPLKGVIDLAAERARLDKEMAKCDADIARVDNKLGNPNFVSRAPEEVVEEEKEKRDEALARRAKIAGALERLRVSDILEANEKMLRALRELFEKAKAAQELHFVMALMPEFRGAQDAGWNTAEEAIHAFEQFSEALESLDKSDLVRVRIALAFYMHVAEGSGFYEIPKKLLLTIEGRGNNIIPFQELVRTHEETGAKIAPNANAIMKALAAHARELGLIELSEVFRDAFDADVRNAIAHADYILAPDGMRLRRRNGGNVRIIPWNEFDALISRGLNLFSFIRQLVDEYARSYYPPKTIKSHMTAAEPITDFTLYYGPNTGAFGLTTGKEPPKGYNDKAVEGNAPADGTVS